MCTQLKDYIMSGTPSGEESKSKHTDSDRNSKLIGNNCDNFNRFTSKPHSRKWHDIHRKRVKLPVWKHKETFLRLLDENQTLILVGETGSGKTTQIPQWCLEYCWQKSSSEGNRRPCVACTQPRRIAAMSVATRVAEEMDVVLGEQVGYSIRFEACTSAKTVLKYLTDGMLLREATFLSDLSHYGVIVLDEAHERTLQTEILFGVLKRAIASRNAAACGGDSSIKPLKVVVMSATINVKLFKKYFDAPILRIEGRQYPVQNLVAEVPQSDLLTSTLTCVFQVHRNCEEGDILVFCSGQDEIQSLVILTKKVLRYAATQPSVDDSLLNLVPFPLYASLPAAQQMQVFNRELQLATRTNGIMTNGNGKSKNGEGDDDYDSDESTSRMIKLSATKHKIVRRVIYATNVAETSVTIPNIRYVIDTGKVKCRDYCPKTGLESLKITNISKAQAKQRSGRAGRVGPGTCYRLFTTEDYDKMPEHSVPEIKRCNLEAILLQLIAIASDNIKSFEFLERPDDERIKSALRNLLTLKAITPSNKLKSNNNQNSKVITNGTTSSSAPTAVATSTSSTSQSESNKSLIAVNPNSRNVNPAILADDNELMNLSYDLTSLGSKLRLFPLHPSMARIIIAANDLGCLDEALTVVSLLAIENLFHIPPNKQGQADAVLNKFHSNEGDTIMLLNVFRAFRRTSVINRKGLKQWCMDHFIHIKNLKLARLIRKQLLQLTKSQLGMQSSTCSQDTSLLRRALTYGLYNNVATMWDGKYRNRTSTKEIFIHPSSCLFKARPECILYVEVVETNKCYMRNCTLIDMNWVREVSAASN